MSRVPDRKKKSSTKKINRAIIAPLHARDEKRGKGSGVPNETDAHATTRIQRGVSTVASVRLFTSRAEAFFVFHMKMEITVKKGESKVMKRAKMPADSKSARERPFKERWRTLLERNEPTRIGLTIRHWDKGYLFSRLQCRRRTPRRVLVNLSSVLF
jgi:hypothetical protein